jgi:hypothetical protein
LISAVSGTFAGRVLIEFLSWSTPRIKGGRGALQLRRLVDPHIADLRMESEDLKKPAMVAKLRGKKPIDSMFRVE